MITISQSALEEIRELYDSVDIENQQYEEMQPYLAFAEDDWDADHDSLLEYEIKCYERAMENEQ